MTFKIAADLRQFKIDNAALINTVLPNAIARGMNNMAFEARKALGVEMRRVFDRPTPYIANSPFVTMAKPDALTATVSMRYPGGKGIDPEQVLQAEVIGGPRALKRYEIALQRAGVLPKGFFTVPGTGVADKLDAFGNLRGAFLVQLISYFGAFGEQGYKANMTDKRKKSLAKVGKSAGGFKTINGVQYFLSYGKLRGGKDAHFAPGIWSRSGTHGSNVKSVLMFVRQPVYKPRLNIEAVGALIAATAPREMDRALTYELKKLGAKK